MGTDTITLQEQLLIIICGCLFASVVYHIRLISWYASRITVQLNACDRKSNTIRLAGNGASTAFGVYWKLPCIDSGLLLIYLMLKL